MMPSQLERLKKRVSIIMEKPEFNQATEKDILQEVVHDQNRRYSKNLHPNFVAMTIMELKDEIRKQKVA